MTKNGLHGDNFREGIFISEWEIIIKKYLNKLFIFFFFLIELGVLLVMNNFHGSALHM